MRVRLVPYPNWLLFILRPLNNPYTWRLRLRILVAMNPPHFKQR
jgi:hypothetical protein